MRENKKEMPKAKGLQKSLQVCFSKLRKSSSHLQLPSNPLSPKNWLLSACKYPRTHSFAVDRHKSNGHDGAATLADIERFLFENFGSRCSDEGNGSNDNNKDHYANVFTSHFFMCLGGSNSEASSSASTSDDMVEAVSISSVAVVTITMDPCDEFRRSMQKMVMARQMNQCQSLDWDFSEDLFFCYLNLNEKRAHYILGAFVDMMVGSRGQPEKTLRRQGKNLAIIERMKRVKDL